MRTIKRFAVGLLMTLTAALLAVGATGCTAKGDRENREHVCSWEIVKTTDATCTKASEVTFECSCGKTKTQTVGTAKGHAYEIEKEAVAPTCKTDGKTAVLKCTRKGCSEKTGGVTNSTNKSLGGHDGERKDEKGNLKTLSNPNSKYATCQHGAFCGDCGEYYTEKLTDHTPELVVYKAKAPTCTLEGWDEYVECSKCSYSTQEKKAALGHDEVDFITSRPATCVSLGYCGRCNETYGDFKAHDANYNEKDPTYCGSKSAICGLSKAYCGACNQYWGDFPNHVLDSFNAVEPTCDTVGYYAYVKCKTCSYTTYQEIAALGHRFEVIPEVKPTCTATGWTEGLHCLNCYDVIVEPVLVKALGHDGEREGQATERDLLHYASYLPDCTHAGYCGFCGTMYGAGKVTGNHDLVTVPAKAATCQADGWDEHIKCKYCHYSTYEENVIPKVAHEPRTYAAEEATCTTPGAPAWTGCIYCMTRPTIPALGHDGERQGQTTKDDLLDADSYLPNCERYGYCGLCDSYYGTHNNGHVQGVAPTCTTPAICKECGEEYGSPYGHRFVGGECVYCNAKKED